ncbi:hypothetical protein ACIOWI_32620 [Streptomyces sp. NPDC087659]|uniref:hypothetical protein n=1 Tax=unclassified Streptomyces TaxID=2593676 RepID=UPI0033E45375
MTRHFDGVAARDGARVPAEHIPAAVTAGTLVYSDGATQTFDADGSTRYFETGRRTEGTWSVDGNGDFCSFWPPSYRASYRLQWVVEEGEVVGLRFSDLKTGARFDGRYQ